MNQPNENEGMTIRHNWETNEQLAVSLCIQIGHKSPQMDGSDWRLCKSCRPIKEALDQKDAKIESQGERIRELEEQSKVCTGCGSFEVPVKPPAFACCPDNRYRTASEILVELDIANSRLAQVESQARKIEGMSSLLESALFHFQGLCSCRSGYWCGVSEKIKEALGQNEGGLK